tara:strand:- start:269 stop:1006 length:738 start_codon:yes stop_codon:yes gene_type:complete
MNKPLTIIGTILVVISLFAVVYSFVAATESTTLNSENILHDTSTDGDDFNFYGEAFVLHVYAKGNVQCNTFDLSVTAGANEYFQSDCGSFEIDSYTYLGELTMTDSGIYQINSEGDIVIKNGDDIGFAGMGIICGGISCFLGLILLIVGLVIGGKKKQNIVYIQQQPNPQQNQQPVQEHMAPAQTSVSMSTVVTAIPTPTIQATGPSTAMNGILDDNGYEWLDFEGRKYWRPQGSNSTWYPHEQR